ncbi:penicillin-binding protein activator LpoB [Glaciimonas sp. PCH181]|nr:penicillin-binding protein activator LpoB [Glaciimonas sp. PCH181]
MAATALSGCAVIKSTSAVDVQRGDSIALLPIINLTETPQAGARAEVLVETLLQADGFTQLKHYAGTVNSDTLFQNIDRDAVEQATATARTQKAKYGLTGSVQEWRYKVGVDGEPAVGISLKLINIETGEVVWTASGSRSGWSRDAVSGVAQKLIGQLLSSLAK